VDRFVKSRDFKIMDNLRTGTPQNDLRCDDRVAEWDWGLSSDDHRGRNVTRPERVVLVVEDDWLLRQDLVEQLAAVGWSVIEAESGESALEILDDGLATIRLLITDIQLGGATSGWDVAEAARDRDDDFPVIYVSASPILDDRRVRGSAFLSKPCVITELLATCQALSRAVPKDFGQGL
jgi:CheY-like chemotaxis protein